MWNNARDKSKGYNIKEGSYEMVKDFQVSLGRPKKKEKLMFH